MLDVAVREDVLGAVVTILPPDDSSLTNAAPRLNLFLYQVAPSAAWRNADLPTRRQDGSLAARPQLGLDLYYLLTAYGQSTDADPQVHRVLGSAMRTLHERPLLSRDEISGVVNASPPEILGTSNLADQVELVKVTPHSLSTEELSKIWSVFFQTPYRISVAYQASVVLIDGKESPTSALPVRERAIYVSPFRRPEILGVEPQMIEPAAGAKLTITGRNLRADAMVIRFGTREAAPDQPVRDDRLTVTLPEGVPAGINTVQVVHQREMGSPLTLRTSAESNTAAFMLRPRITTPPPITAAPGTTLTLNCEPAVGRAQSVALLVGEREIDIPARSATGPAETTSLDFPIPDDFPPGSYLLRLRVEGVESALQVDPDTGNNIGPLVEIES
jgi:hypothetical protein